VQETTSFEDPKHGVTEEMMSESSHASPPRGGEPGIRANTGLRVTTAIQSMAAGPTSSDSTERVASVPAFGRSDQRVTDPGGYALEINASVGIPRSYYVALYRMRTGSDPNDPVAGEAFEELVRSSLESIEAQVQPLIATGSMEGSRQGEVTVSIFEDISSSSAPNEARQAAMTAGFNPTGGPAGPNSWVTDAGLGLLVLLAMGMMVLMLRRVGRLKTIGPEVLDRPLLPEDVEVLGDVDDTDVVLDGVEIDQEEVRRRVMLDQIRDAVEAHPEESASVLRRWTRADS
jgi:flagellar biosynthesis/type III secretory pathway M-ring protein FliF/YscJ